MFVVYEVILVLVFLITLPFFLLAGVLRGKYLVNFPERMGFYRAKAAPHDRLAHGTAETPVWRQEDGPQCAEGGRAHVELQWRGDRIAVGIVRIGKAGECGEALPH